MFGDQNTNDKGWSESLVKDEFKLSMGKTPARNNPECWDNGNHKWVSISDMSSYARYTGDTSEYITDYAIADSGIKPVPKGTIIMSFKLSIGRTAITSEDIYTNEAIMAFADFDEKKFNIDFLHFLIANKNWLLGAKQAVKGQTLNKESIGNAKIIIPPIEMQEQFASIYNQADKSEFVGCKSQFFEMFEGDEYPLIKLGDYTDLTWGDTNTTKNSYVTEGYLAYSASGPDGKLDHYDYDCEGIVLSAIGADCGKTWFASGKWSCIKNTIRFWSTFDDLDNRFLYFATREKDFWPRRGGAQPFIPQGDARNCSIPLPPICLQRKFVEIAEQADKSEYYN